MKRISGVELNRFFDEQMGEWPMAKANFDALSAVRIRTVEVSGVTFKIQFNPGRVRSSLAKIDAATLASRKCFLCCDNRPMEQRRLAWDDEYEIMVNPYPIFARHFTIPTLSHIPQLIAHRIEAMMEMAEAFDDYEIFYNGPQCGASAPDHMHFQAGQKGLMPWLGGLDGRDEEVICGSDEAVMSIVNKVRAAVVIRSSTIAGGSEMFARLEQALPVRAGECEPMHNVLCAKCGAEWITTVFPRRALRPRCFYAEGDEKLVVSPASVEMGGLMTLPFERDFLRMGEREIRQVFNEVSYASAEIAEMTKHLKQN